MTVKKLIEYLQSLPPEMPVVVWCDSAPRGTITGVAVIRSEDKESFRLEDEKWELSPFVILDCDDGFFGSDALGRGGFCLIAGSDEKEF